MTRLALRRGSMQGLWAIHTINGVTYLSTVVCRGLIELLLPAERKPGGFDSGSLNFVKLCHSCDSTELTKASVVLALWDILLHICVLHFLSEVLVAPHEYSCTITHARASPPS
jgi:hypothetical protein